MAKKTKKKKIRKRIIIWSLIILFILYVSIFVVLRPFMGEITQDRPIMRVLCEMQADCSASRGDYYCSSNGGTYDEKFKKWSDYNGCNESTEGYSVYENGGKKWGRVYVESCVCGGLM